MPTVICQRWEESESEPLIFGSPKAGSQTYLKFLCHLLVLAVFYNQDYHNYQR